MSYLLLPGCQLSYFTVRSDVWILPPCGYTFPLFPGCDILFFTVEIDVLKLPPRGKICLYFPGCYIPFYSVWSDVAKLPPYEKTCPLLPGSYVLFVTAGSDVPKLPPFRKNCLHLPACCILVFTVKSDVPICYTVGWSFRFCQVANDRISQSGVNLLICGTACPLLPGCSLGWLRSPFATLWQELSNFPMLLLIVFHCGEWCLYLRSLARPISFS